MEGRWVQTEKKNNMYSLTFYTQALNPLKTARGVAETRLTVEKLPKDHNSGKQSVEHDRCIFPKSSHTYIYIFFMGGGGGGGGGEQGGVEGRWVQTEKKTICIHLLFIPRL